MLKVLFDYAPTLWENLLVQVIPRHKIVGHWVLKDSSGVLKLVEAFNAGFPGFVLLRQKFEPQALDFSRLYTNLPQLDLITELQAFSDLVW